MSDAAQLFVLAGILVVIAAKLYFVVVAFRMSTGAGLLALRTPQLTAPTSESKESPCTSS